MVGACGPTGHTRAVLVRFTLQGYNESIRRQSLSDMSTLIAAPHRSNALWNISEVWKLLSWINILCLLWLLRRCKY